MDCIRTVLAGHPDAYAELVHRYQHMVFRVCLKMTTDPTAAEDLAQEVFIKAYDGLPSYREEANFSTWLYQITVRKCIDWRRMEERDRKHRERTGYTEADLVSTESPEQALLDQEERSALHQVVEELKEPYRTVVRCFYIHQFSYQDIAQRTGLPVKTIESQLYRARKMLRKKGAALR